MKFSTNNSNHRITLKGEIINRNDPNPRRREIGIEKAESRKLPLNDYPLTHIHTPEGLEALASSSHGQCQISFHRYPEGSHFGEGAYIGSATKRLNNDLSQAEKFSTFLEQAGVFKPGTLVNLDFVKYGQVINVYISGFSPTTAKSSPPLVTP